jgi:hypothetical protein
MCTVYTQNTHLHMIPFFIIETTFLPPHSVREHFKGFKNPLHPQNRSHWFYRKL